MFGGIDRRMTVRSAYLMLGVASVAMGCFGGGKEYDDDDDDDAGSSGEGSSGGTKSSGGSGGSGGSNGGSTSGSSSGGTTGGSVNGGSTSGSSGSTGGDVASGGVSGSNGGSAAGGSAATGGSTGGTMGGGSGGSVAGDTSTGGTGGSTGGTGGGGSGGDAGGGTISCDTSFDTHDGGYVTSPGSSGCWQGYAYTVADSFGTTVSPSVFSACTEDSCSLCVSGTIVADALYESFAGLGFNVNQSNQVDAPLNAVIPAGAGLTISFTNPGGTTLRAQIQSASIQWCYTLTGSSGTVTIPYSSFNTACWDAVDGAYYAGEAITGVQLTVPGSGVYTTPYSFCLVSAKDGT